MQVKRVWAAITAGVICLAAGCSSNPFPGEKQENTISEENFESVNPVTRQEEETGNEESAKRQDESKEETFLEDELYTGWLPDGVTQLMAEPEPYDLLREKIIEYYEIPEEYLESTKYYYNYVDLNEDGTEEIFAVVIGSYTSGSGGSSALWCREFEGEMQVLQAFTLVNTPIIISEDTANGEKHGGKILILQRSGGGSETEIVQLICMDGIYTDVADGQMVECMDDIKGTAIICNNMMEDNEQGSFLTLAR